MLLLVIYEAVAVFRPSIHWQSELFEPKVFDRCIVDKEIFVCSCHYPNIDLCNIFEPSY